MCQLKDWRTLHRQQRTGSEWVSFNSMLQMQLQNKKAILGIGGKQLKFELECQLNLLET